jgi:hypothetical protein
MKKFFKFLKEYYKPILKGLFLAAVLIYGYTVLHNIATAQRGYNAIGGEIFVFFIPYLWWAIKKLKEGTENELD